jgi:hypothetical protein
MLSEFLSQYNLPANAEVVTATQQAEQAEADYQANLEREAKICK